MKKHGRIFVVVCICLAISGCRKVNDNTGSQRMSEQRPTGKQITAFPEKTDSDSKENQKKKITLKPKKEKKSELGADTMVKVLDYIPDVQVDLRYATKNNFTGKKIYDFKEAYLRYGTVLKLKKAQNRLKREKYTLLIWDAYRPVSAQYRLWNICPNPAYVANPHKGYSSHSRGNTVDITMVTYKGKKVKMPTDFDDFSEKADRDYSDCSYEERKNARKLESIMKEEGFVPYSGEWWHFSDADKYPVKKSMSAHK